jgi:hypothetical protein
MGSGGHGVRILEPPCIDTIVVGDAFDLAGNQVGGDILDLSGGNTAVNGAGLDPGALQYHCAGGNDGIGADTGIVHDDSTHANQHFILDCTAMYDGIMTDRYVVADYHLGFLVGSVDDDAILDVYFVTDPDAVDIAPDDGIEPDTALIANLHVTYHGGIGRQKTIFAKAGEFAFYRQYSCHDGSFYKCTNFAAP